MVDKFLKESALAEAVEVDTKIVLHRLRMSAEDLEVRRSEGRLPVAKNRRESVELEVNGLIVAEGVIVRKRGETYFKVTRMKED